METKCQFGVINVRLVCLQSCAVVNIRSLVELVLVWWSSWSCVNAGCWHLWWSVNVIDGWRPIKKMHWLIDLLLVFGWQSNIVTFRFMILFAFLILSITAALFTLHFFSSASLGPSLLWLVGSHRPEQGPTLMSLHQLCSFFCNHKHGSGVIVQLHLDTWGSWLGVVTVSLWHHKVTKAMTAHLKAQILKMGSVYSYPWF